LVIENYSNHKAMVRLQDRLPYAGMTQDVRVTLVDTPDLSSDPLYLQLDRPKGILRWDIEVPANASGQKARIVEYGYKAEFDRNYVLATPATGKTPMLQIQFEEQQRRLQKQ
jgi:hypothetical protein